jgi:hypothetical protein
MQWSVRDSPIAHLESDPYSLAYQHMLSVRNKGKMMSKVVKRIYLFLRLILLEYLGLSALKRQSAALGFPNKHLFQSIESRKLASICAPSDGLHFILHLEIVDLLVDRCIPDAHMTVSGPGKWGPSLFWRRPPSPHHRILVALHSHDGIVETGLLGCPPEKRAATLATNN